VEDYFGGFGKLLHNRHLKREDVLHALGGGEAIFGEKAGGFALIEVPSSQVRDLEIDMPAIVDELAGRSRVGRSAPERPNGWTPEENVLVPLDDPVALAENICWFLEKESARRQLGEKLRITAREKYGLDRMIDAAEELYRGIV